MTEEKIEPLKAWVVTVDMGLGHRRATYPLRDIAEGGIITAGGEGFADESEKKLWDRIRNSYEFLSRIRSFPVIGKPLFNILDRIQNIPPFYPIKDMSSPSMQVKLVQKYIEKGMARGVLKIVKQKPLPIISSHPIPALAADYQGLTRNYCIIADAQISRAWVAVNPESSHIHYCAPCGRAVMRLRSYGVPDGRIFLTGFPFPLKLLGDKNLSVLKSDTAQRLHYLDPNNRFWPLHHINVEHFLGRRNCRFKKNRVLTITYAVGGAGAQKETGYKIAKSLKEKLINHRVRLILVAGMRDEVRDYFEKTKAEILPDTDDIRIIYGTTTQEYFEKFDDAIRETDILWTKPSELSFYSGLGIPIVMSPTIGSQEEYNRKWLLEIQAGIQQNDPEYASEWLFDLIKEGRLAESAWDGFLKARKYGTYKIREILETGIMVRETSPLKR